MVRDFTYIDDVVESISRIIKKPPKKNLARILNVGNSKKIKLETHIKSIEECVGVKAKSIPWYARWRCSNYTPTTQAFKN